MNLSNFRQGLGQLAEKLPQALFPVPAEVSRGVDPETVDALRKQAWMQLGLGMLAAKDRGAGLGSGIALGLNQAQQGLGGGLGEAYAAKRNQREEERLGLQDQRLDLYDQRQQSMLEAQGRAEQRGIAERAAQAEQQRLENERWERQFSLEKQRASAGGTPVNQQLITRPVGNGLVQDFAWDPRSNARMPSGEPYKPVTTHSGNPSEGERVSANYAGRMGAAETLLGDFKPGFKDYVAGLQVMKGGATTSAAANALLSDQGQKYYQAASDWVRAKLRKESGAVIAPEEMAQEIKTYFPVPGDSAATIAQKRQAREQAMAGMRQMSGRAIPPGASNADGWSIELVP